MRWLGDMNTCEGLAVALARRCELLREPGSLQALVQVPSGSFLGPFRGFSSSWDDWCGLLARGDHLRGWSIGLHLFVRRLVWWLVTSPSAEFDEFLVPGEEVARVCLDSIPPVIELAIDATVGVP